MEEKIVTDEQKIILELVSGAESRVKALGLQKNELDKRIPKNLDYVKEVLKNTIDCTKPTNVINTKTKLLHDLTHQAEFVEFAFATSAIPFEVIYRGLSILPGLASIFGIIAAFIEWKQLSKRIKAIEWIIAERILSGEDEKDEAKKPGSLTDIILVLLAHQSHSDEPDKKKDSQVSDEEKSEYEIIRQKEFLAHWEGRIQRAEIDLKQLKRERITAIASLITSIIALALLLGTGIDIELLLLGMIAVDKLIHFNRAQEKSFHADKEIVPLQLLKTKDKKALKEFEIEFEFNSSETFDRPCKRQWKKIIRSIEVACGLLACAIGIVGLVSQAHWVLPVAITIIAIDGATKLFWAVYQELRRRNKKQLVSNENAKNKNVEKPTSTIVSSPDNISSTDNISEVLEDSKSQDSVSNPTLLDETMSKIKKPERRVSSERQHDNTSNYFSCCPCLFFSPRKRKITKTKASETKEEGVILNESVFIPQVS